MRAILIDPEAKTVTEMEINNDWRRFQKLVSYTDERVLLQPLEIDYSETMLVDEEGLLKRGLHAFNYLDYPHRLVGKALIVGTNANGDTVSTGADVEEIEASIHWRDDVSDGTVPPAVILPW